MRQVLDTNELVYFPQEYIADHHGMTKLEAIHAKHICAIPGWSVGLVESHPIIPAQGQGQMRKQLELGHSPREYLQILKEPMYQGENGKTLEDFITHFLVYLATIHEVSNDVDDYNALWCLARYFRIS